MNTPDVWYGGAWGYPPKDNNNSNTTIYRGKSNINLPGHVPTLFDTIQPIPIPDPPSITMPILDTNRVASLTQEFASPTIRAGRNALRETLAGGSRSNPVSRGYQIRGAIQGFGDTVEKAVGGARQPAVSLANQEMMTKFDTDKTNANMSWAKTLMDYNEKLKLRDLQIDEKRRSEDLLRLKEKEDKQLNLMRGGQDGQDGRGNRNRFGQYPFISQPTLRTHGRPFTSYKEDFEADANKFNAKKWFYDSNRGWIDLTNEVPSGVSEEARRFSYDDIYR